MPTFNIKKVKEAADRHGVFKVLGNLCPELKQASEKRFKPQRCPNPNHHKQGPNEFMFKADGEIGASCCRTCGENRDLFATLKMVKTWPFPVALEKVAEYLNVDPIIKYDIETVRHAVEQHGALKIIGQLAPSLSDACSSPGKRHYCPNPGHKQKSGQAFRFFKDADVSGGSICNTCGGNPTIFDTLKFANNWSFKETLKEVANAVGVKPLGSDRLISDFKDYKKPEARKATWKRPSVSKYSDAEIAKNREKLKTLYEEALPLNKRDSREIAFNYFTFRGLDAQKAIEKSMRTMRVHLNLPYYEEVVINGKSKYKEVGKFPALIIKYSNPQGRCVNLHRIYLNEKGIGKLNQLSRHTGKKLDAKKSCIPAGEMRHGFMPISIPDGTILATCEGFETGLVPETVLNLPTRCASAGLAKYIDIPQNVDLILHFTDPDSAGLNDAEELEKRCLELGKEFVRLLPPVVPGKVNADWLDVLSDLGPDAVNTSFKTQLLGSKRRMAA